MTSSLRLFTLIHLSRTETSTHNAAVSSSDQQMAMYLACAQQLAESLRPVGIELVVLTNDRAALLHAVPDTPLPLVEIPFDLAVPSGIRFYSAHFKVDVFRYFGTLSDDAYVGLVDSDVMCINPVPLALAHAIERQVPLYFDVTDQVTPAHGADAIVRDKERMQNEASLGMWAGGEFIAGPPSFFRAVYDEAVRVSPAYFGDFGAYHHQSDETLVSVALENLMRRGAVMPWDAGHLSILGRYWSGATLHVQRPLPAFATSFLLHVPADKPFLTSLVGGGVTLRDRFRLYESYVRRLHLLRPIHLVASKAKHVRRQLLRRLPA